MSDPAEIARITNEVTAVVTHPAFLQMMEKIQSLPEPERQKEAEKVAQVRTLQQHGIPLPTGLRVSTRWFENPASAQLKVPDPSAVASSDFQQETTICVSVGAIVCVSVGGDF